MKLFLSMCALFLFGISFGQKLKLDQKNVKIDFYFHGDKVNGTVQGFKGDIEIDLADLEKSKVNGSVKANTIQTGIKMRDNHLHSKDYFHADKFPEIKFSSTKITIKNEVINVTGKLKIKEIEREERFELRIKEGEIVLTAQINTEDYEIMKKKDRNKTKVDITITIPKLD
jgi:polyisoprenoid-binding protein YceI